MYNITSKYSLNILSKGLDMKLRDMFIPYVTVGIILTFVMVALFGHDKASAFIVTYTIGYAAVMVYLAGSK